jgi:hypothetical protein
MEPLTFVKGRRSSRLRTGGHGRHLNVGIPLSSILPECQSVAMVQLREVSCMFRGESNDTTYLVRLSGQF